MAHHLDLLADCKKAISRLMSDRSVSAATTRSSLEELRDEIEELIETLPESHDED